MAILRTKWELNRFTSQLVRETLPVSEAWGNDSQFLPQGKIRHNANNLDAK